MNHFHAIKKFFLTRIIRTTKQTHAYSGDSATHIVTTIGDTLKSFVSGGTDNIVTGVGNLMSLAVEAFLGEAAMLIHSWSEKLVAFFLTGRVYRAQRTATHRCRNRCVRIEVDVHLNTGNR